MTKRKPSKSLRVGVLLKGSLADAMAKESEKTLAAFSAITRAALVEYFSKRGYNVEDNVSWGGPRSQPSEEQGEGQPVAVAAK